MPQSPISPGAEPAAASPAVPLRFAGRGQALGRDVLAGLTLAAITIPEQMATARLGGFEPQTGFFAFVAATVGFALFGASRVMTVGADSTITPIFAGSLAMLVAGGASLGVVAPALALLVGVVLLLAGMFRLGWIADLLSTPVITGFLAGVAVHILVSQLPALFGLPAGSHSLVAQVQEIYARRSAIAPLSTLIGLSVLAIMLACERFAAWLPGALIALGLATGAVMLFGLEARGVAVLGNLPEGLPLHRPTVPVWENIRQLVPLALILALVVMMQSATVSRSFRTPGEPAARVDRDFLGLGAANLLAFLAGAFPVNASPPRTGVMVESGATSQLAALTAAAIVLALAVAGGSLLAHVPEAALAGVLLFVAQRIFRLGTILSIARQAPAEFGLIVATALAIIVLPIESGVAIGIGLSLVHGVWMTTRSRPVELHQIAGTTIWWPPDSGTATEPAPDVLVVAFQAPLLFANAQSFQRGMLAELERRRPALLVIEAGGIAAIDYTAAQAVLALAATCRERGVAFAIARVESVRASQALRQFGIIAAIGADHVFHSVDEAVTALRPSHSSETRAHVA